MRRISLTDLSFVIWRRLLKLLRGWLKERFLKGKTTNFLTEDFYKLCTHLKMFQKVDLYGALLIPILTYPLITGVTDVSNE